MIPILNWSWPAGRRKPAGDGYLLPHSSPFYSCTVSSACSCSEPWLFVLALAGWGLLALIHMIVLPIWMLIASLRYWEVNRRMLAVTGLLFSILAPVCMVLMLSCWSVSG